LEQERCELDPWALYIYAMKAPLTREKYKKRLAKFLDFIGIGARDGNSSLEDKASSPEARVWYLRFHHRETQEHYEEPQTY